MIFGRELVVRPINPELSEAVMRVFRFGDVKDEVKQISASHMVKTKEDALSHILPALKHLENGTSHYSYFEVFTDERGISRMVVSHMEKVTK